MERLQPPDLDNLTPEQEAVAQAIIAGPRKAVIGPMRIWLHRPDLGQHAQRLGQYCRFDSSLPPELSELAILVTARVWSSEFEWSAHKKIALDAGVSPAIIEAIRTHAEPPFENDTQRAIYDFARMLHTERKVSDAVYAAAVKELGSEGVVDLTGILGYYTLVSMTLNVFEVPGEGPPEMT
ncbi:carboxymuconolactone decarboxylase family protein [Acuticoccus sediminis]|uniref:carboxymuconolactone decarboxylase family protein n=1 Tax=Acuticoccus sediminis TaxID=2184697 RepID=UPI001CFD467C|nr:carboxymuconolactone decarboxylase family protein [Acuticoccus sediminis]